VARHATRPLLVIGHAFNGAASTPGNGQMIALLAADRKTVRLCHALALENGGVCEGETGLRPQYHAAYYGAYFRDPDGNKLCVCCHAAEAEL
jgi:catechol 2,3-dioxygenase-like lactoylglutathione lyase family enzyme